MVSIPPNMTGTGKRERRFFDDDKAAEKLAKRLRSEYASGMRGGVIDAGLARMAADAAKLLEPCGLSILEAARIVAKQFADSKGTDETFRERFDRFTRTNETRWSDRYRGDMEKIPRWVGSSFMDTPCAVISDATIETALRANGAGSTSTVKARRARVVAVMAAKEKRGRTAPPDIMTVKQCAAMLRACRGPAERQAVALLLFAGIRPDAESGEISRLDWSDVGPDHITIHPETSKTGTDRHIPITPRLRRLLKGRPPAGPVIPPNWQRRIQAIRKDAGIARKQDITRHTFASHYLAAFGEDATKSAMGHTENSRTLFRHYRRAVLDAAGSKYFR
jgi:integrase